MSKSLIKMVKLAGISEEGAGLEKLVISISPQPDKEIVFKKGKIADFEDIRIENKSESEFIF